jgi:hypothetical protein
MDDDKRAELLMQHYANTYENIQNYWKIRNRLFLLILALLTVLVLDWAQPGSLASVANSWIVSALTNDSSTSDQIQAIPKLAFSVIGTLVRFILLCLVIQYYQRSIHVDRLYRYISDIEEKLCASMGGDFVTREGKAYFSATGVYAQAGPGKRPFFLRAVGPLYVYAFPVVLIFFALYGLKRCGWHPRQVTCWLDFLFGLGIIFYNLAYVRWVAFKK